MENTVKKQETPSRIRRFLNFLSTGYSVRAARDRRRWERTRLRTERVLTFWHKTHLRRLLCYLRNALFMTDLRALSLLFAPMALCVCARCLVLPLITDDYPLLPLDGAAGAFLLLVSLLLMTYKAPLYRAVTEDRLLSHLFFTTLALPRPYITMTRGIRWFFLLPLGIGLAVLSVYASPLLLLLILVGTLLFLLMMASPEFGLLLLGVIFPLSALFPDAFIPIAAILGITLLSYLFKLFLGKRDIHFEPIGLFLAIFVAVNLIFSFSGSFASIAGGLKLGAVAVCGYFLTANLLANKRTASFFTRGMISTVTVLSAFSIFSAVVNLFFADTELSSVTRYLLWLNGRFFPTEDILPTCLILLLPLLLGILADRTESHLIFILPLLILLAALILSVSPIALAAFTLALVLFTLLNSGGRTGIFFLICTVLPNAVLFLPEELCHRFASFFPFLGLDRMITKQLALLAESFALLKANPLGAVESAFTDGASLYLGVGLQSGLPGLITLILMLAFVARDALRTADLERNNRHRTLPHGCTSALFAVLVYAPFRNIFSDIRTALLFFLTLGMLTAVCRIGWLEDELHRRHMQDDDHESYATEMRIAH